MLERELAENLLAQSRSIIEALNLILLDVKPGDCSREIYDRLRLRVGHAIGAVIQLKQLVYEPYPEMNELANLKLAEVEGNAEQRIEILLPASVSPPPQNLDFAYASRIQAPRA